MGMTRWTEKPRGSGERMREHRESKAGNRFLKKRMASDTGALQKPLTLAFRVTLFDARLCTRLRRDKQTCMSAAPAALHR